MLTCCDPCGIDDLMYNLILEVVNLAYAYYNSNSKTRGARAACVPQKQVARVNRAIFLPSAAQDWSGSRSVPLLEFGLRFGPV